MKFLQKQYDREYDLSLVSFNDEITELDKYVFEKIDREKRELVAKAEKFIGQVVDYSNPLFEGGLVLNSIETIGTAERAYSVALECFFAKDEHMYWTVTFNFPLVHADQESVEKGRFWPIEFKRRVE